MSFTDRDCKIMLAASQGAFDAVTQPHAHLGDAARARGLRSRTLKGDAYETAFEWAREEARLRRCLATDETSDVLTPHPPHGDAEPL